MIEKEFIDLPEVAEYLGVSIDTVYRYMRSETNPMPAIKISRKRLLVNKKELDEWLFSFREEQR